MSARAAGISYEALCLQPDRRRGARRSRRGRGDEGGRLTRWPLRRCRAQLGRRRCRRRAPDERDRRRVRRARGAAARRRRRSSGSRASRSSRSARSRVEGDVARNSVSTIRANAAPQLAGNFLTIDLGAVRRAFESVPWVRLAIVRRVWPNRLRVRLEEHRPVALWGSDERRRQARQQLRRGLRGQRRRRRGRRPADARRPRRQLGARAGDARPDRRRARAARRAHRAAVALGPRLVAGDARQRRRDRARPRQRRRAARARGALRRDGRRGDRRATTGRSSRPTCATPTATRCA